MLLMIYNQQTLFFSFLLLIITPLFYFENTIATTNACKNKTKKHETFCKKFHVFTTQNNFIAGHLLWFCETKFYFTDVSLHTATHTI